MTDMMKKVIFAAAAAVMMLSGTNAFAQFSVGAGYMNSKLKEKDADDPYAKANGFYVGADYNFNLFKGLGIAPGIELAYVIDGDVASLNLSDLASVKEKIRESYLNIPVAFNYGYDFSKVRVFAFAGPVFSIGLTSKSKTEGAVLDSTGSDTENLYDGDYRRFDVMLGCGVGADLFEKFRVKIGYDWGLVNRYDADNYTVHRKQLKIGVALLF